IENFDFQPAVITVSTGTTVTWTNKDIEQHTVTARDKAFNSDVINSDKTFTYTFTKAGSFEYFCQIHPHMVGTVVVTDK
ncbi:MAG: cupredoxin domain-containing protein, partial [Chloroflexota bacterium]